MEIWVEGNLPSLPHNLSQFPLLPNCWSKFRTYVLFLYFLVFQVWHFDFSLVKAPIVFYSLYIWNFGFDSPQINTSKEPKGRFGLILHFWPLSQKHPWHFGESTGESSNWNKRGHVSEDAKPAKDGISHTNLSVHKKPCNALPCKKSIVELS